MKINGTRGLCRVWAVGSILWVIYWVPAYYAHCYKPYFIACKWGSESVWSQYYVAEFVISVFLWFLGIPAVAFVLGVIGSRVGAWIYWGFRSSDTLEPN
jgi:hypothetical protein